jgi:hypothetical protein
VFVIPIYRILGTDLYGSSSHLVLMRVMGLFVSLFSFVYFVVM